MSRAALAALHQCTAALSLATASQCALATRSVAHLSRRPSPLSPQRTYSTQGVSQEQAAGSTANSAAAKNDSNKRAEAGTASESSTPDIATELQAKLKAKEEEVLDYTSRLRYLQADFLNLQRNAAREKEQTKDYAITKFAGDLLETVDVLSLALKSVPESALKAQKSSSDPMSSEFTPSSSQTETSPSQAPTKSAQEYLAELHHGVEMTHRLLLQTLFKYNVKPFDPTGDKFDPNRSEALYQAPVPGKEPGTVISCEKLGFTIKDRTLRAAQVGVASEPSS